MKGKHISAYELATMIDPNFDFISAYSDEKNIIDFYDLNKETFNSIQNKLSDLKVDMQIITNHHTSDDYDYYTIKIILL